MGTAAAPAPARVAAAGSAGSGSQRSVHPWRAFSTTLHLVFSLPGNGEQLSIVQSEACNTTLQGASSTPRQKRAGAPCFA